MVPSSLDTWFDEILETLVNNAVSLETKQWVMQRAMSSCPKVTLNVQGKGVPSLLDSGSMVTLIQEGYFEKKYSPFVKGQFGRAFQSSLIIQVIHC